VPIDLARPDLDRLVEKLAPATEGLGLEKVAVHGYLGSGEDPRRGVIEISNPEGQAVVVRIRPPHNTPLEPLTEYTQKVVQLRRRGLMYPYELLRLLAPPPTEAGRGISPGSFVEHDLVEGRLVPVDRPQGQNQANVVVGVVSNVTDRYPEGMNRVVLLGDPSKGMGALSEPECSRIMAAMDLAEEMGIPLEWFAVSGGALIAMDSGTENMDWIGRVLRRIIDFTQAGCDLNVIVTGINVGAQPYWNAEATMLMHTKGVLIMTPESAMVLTGKQALDYSGGVSAEDNQGIGGYERIMGPNGQAQYFARDVADACRVLLRHYDHTYVAPGERFPRPAPTTDPRDRVVGDSPHRGDFATVGEVFSEATNPGRKAAFEIRKVMAAAVDQDHPTLERWYGMEDAEVAVVWDAHLGGYPVCLIGLESKPLARLGFIPADGPEAWTSGTLFPLSSKKVARAINASSDNRPLVVLANLSGFDGSPESMRRWQLEYGAEIGRAVVNFRGPIVFVVISRYHGGAFVVFSATLNENMEVAALEGSHASVIGGAPAAAVVFTREVDRRAQEDRRVAEIRHELAEAEGAGKANLRRRLDEVFEDVRSEKLGEVADEFDHIHNIDRARRVGSVHRIIPAAELRPYLIDAVERGMRRELDRLGR
jgi:acetyl-CoA carboxylase carboxyltransferase component